MKKTQQRQKSESQKVNLRMRESICDGIFYLCLCPLTEKTNHFGDMINTFIFSEYQT